MGKLYKTVVFLFFLTLNLYAGNSGSPLMGWNSFDSYGSEINKKEVWDNLYVFIDKLKPFGYEYFVLDAGWYRYPDKEPAVDEYGRYIPSDFLFPGGFNDIIEYAHSHGVKFGLHLMRGIPRNVVKHDLPIKGTKYTAKDIVNLSDTCSWSNSMYGVDMSKPGAQEYYNSVFELLAEWGVDFVKYDDIVHKPEEITAVVKALARTGRDIKLSISPGDDVNASFLDIYKKTNMVRITRDIWDLQEDIDITFEKWEKMQLYANCGFWFDMDMIPFGHIRLNYPLEHEKNNVTRGYERMDNFTIAQKRTFLTQRALAASPLFMSGSLVSSPNFVFELITDRNMIECNQNGVTGNLIYRLSDYGNKFDVWSTPHKKNKNEGWIGIFNRSEYMNRIRICKEKLGMVDEKKYLIYDIWGKRYIKDADEFMFDIQARDVLFIYLL